jgi:hypothetical protein
METPDVEIPDHLQELNNLTVYGEDIQKAYRIIPEREITFGDTDDVFFQFMYEIAVDNTGRVFISELAMGHRTIHGFAPDGSYLGFIGLEGDGPGEFRTPTHLQISDEWLYIYDNLHQRISKFSLDTFTFLSAFNLPSNQIRELEELDGGTLQKLIVKTDGSYLISFGELTPNTNPRYNYYFLMNQDGELYPEKLFKKRGESILQYRSTNGSSGAGGILPFSRKTLMAVSDENYIFSAFTEEMLIKIYSPQGFNIRSFYHPFSNTLFDQNAFADGLSPSGALYQLLPHMEFPQSWPALEELLIDDENRLWISTIVEDFDIYEWWVLEETGELITKFEWPRDEPIEVIKNGYIYTRQTDEETGLQQIVRYRIELEEV